MLLVWQKATNENEYFLGGLSDLYMHDLRIRELCNLTEGAILQIAIRVKLLLKKVC